MKLKFRNMHKRMKDTTSIWWLLKPIFEKLWMGKIIHVGLNGFYLELDFRGINTREDLLKELKR